MHRLVGVRVGHLTAYEVVADVEGGEGLVMPHVLDEIGRLVKLCVRALVLVDIIQG